MQPQQLSRATAHLARKTQREARLEVALAERDAQRARGETPVLPDPTGRSRYERVLRYVAYEDCRRRRDAGVATPEELAFLEARFAHLSAWRKAKSARRQRAGRRGDDDGDESQTHQPKKKKKRGHAKKRPVPVFVAAPGGGADDERPRLRGPEDLRAFLDARRSS